MFKRDGFFIIDKPRNLLSHEVSSYIRKIIGAEKAGHAGTLDPGVSGVLVVGVNRATKLLRFLTMGNKKYVGVVEFKEEKSYREVSNLFKRFVGTIEQIPPKESAVAKRKRRRKVFYIKILEIEGKRVLFETEVEAGTYIRTLAKDMGGTLIDLRRIQSSCFNEREAYLLDDLYMAKIAYDNGYETLLESMFLSVEEVFYRLDFPKISVSKTVVKNVIRGAPIYFDGIIEYEEFREGDYISVFSENRFVGVGRAEKDKISMERVHIKREEL